MKPNAIRLACAGFAAAFMAAPVAVQAAPDTIVYAFTSYKDGGGPYAGLTSVGGRLYGTTYNGGKYGGGTIFSVTRSGIHRIVHDFGSGSDGSSPFSTLLNIGNTLYGVAEGGGNPCGCGTVFSLSPTGTYTTLYAFKGGTDGMQPQYDLTAINGVIFGTTTSGGAACNCGTVFSITPQGAENIVYAFQGGSDGAAPNGLTTDGTLLYGTTSEGGGTGCGSGCGTAYSLSPAGAETLLHVFANPAKGIVPAGRLLFVGHELYGTTLHSGPGPCGDGGCGTVFRLSPTGAFKSLHSFSLTDGNQPLAGLIDVKDVLYGTTLGGGPKNQGVVFGMTRDGTVSVLHAFTGGSDGIEPAGDLIDVAGSLYGTTIIGGIKDSCGKQGCGTVFNVTP